MYERHRSYALHADAVLRQTPDSLARLLLTFHFSHSEACLHGRLIYIGAMTTNFCICGSCRPGGRFVN